MLSYFTDVRKDWFSVEDKLPEKGKYVLVGKDYTPNLYSVTMAIAKFNENGEFECDMEVTHWSYIPEDMDTLNK